ncbi:MAG: M15 family metallopeptidase [Amaricoccus sp.]|nr:M15 family metallopeptidase [Amaricoccus sp.]
MAQVLKDLLSFGVEMRPYFGIRTPKEQAILWRQSRSKEEIAAAVLRLKQGGAPFLAETLESVGPQNGPEVTKALPGLSWHQWGEAVDCFWAVNGKAEWSSSKIIDGVNGYKEYARRVKQAGLDAGGLWPSFKDWPHAQFRRQGSPTSAGMTLAEIDAEMRKMYG